MAALTLPRWMPEAQQVASALHLAAPLLSAGLLARLWRHGLLRQYPFFALSLAVSVARTGLLLGHDPNYSTYAIIWLLTEPAVWLSYVLVSFEVYSHVLEAYRGISILGRRTMGWVVASSAVLALLSALPELRLRGVLYPILQAVFVVEKGLALSLVLFILFLWVFLSWYPIPLRKNLRLYSLGYTLFFLAIAAGLFVRNLRGAGWTDWVNVLILSAQAICLITWAVMLNREGETVIGAAHLLRRREDEDRLLAELGKLDEMLLRKSGSAGQQRMNNRVFLR